MFGRAAELSEVLTTLRRTDDDRPVALVISGEAGIGKTTLLDDVALAASTGTLVVRASGVEGEHDLPLAGVTDLLRTLRSDIERIVEPHRGVLTAAVERGEPAATMALGLALVRVFDDVMQRHHRLMIVIDDAQWFDELSTATVQFALRRLQQQSLAVLVATRDDSWPGFADAHVVRLDGVDAEVSRLILSRTGEVTPDVAARAAAACGGNPLALEQLGAALSPTQRNGAAALPEPVPIGGRLRAVLSARLDGLPTATCSALAVLAAAGPGDLPALPDALLHLDVSTDDLAAAESRAVIVADDHGFRFTHPLLRDVALDHVGGEGRRRAHRALAATVGEIDRRAHHLDRAADGPDPEAADVLEAVARRAEVARSHDVAAVAWERAARRSLTRPETARRLARAARAYWNAGRPELGLGIGREASSHLDLGADRVLLVLALGDMTFFHEDTGAGIQMMLDEAEAIADTDPAQSATMTCHAANLIALTGDLRRAARVCAEGTDQVAGAGDPIAALVCESLAAHIAVVHGQVVDEGRVAALIDLVAHIDDAAPREQVTLGQLVVFDLLTLGRWEEARSVGRRVLIQARRHGLASVEAFVHGLLGEVAWRTGRWIEGRAESLIEHGFNEARPEPTGSFGHASLARVDAGIGRIDESRHNARRVVEHGRRTGMRVLESWGHHALGLAALAEDEPSAAIEELIPIWEVCLTGEIGAPGPLWWQGDLVEALWRTGQSADLQRLTDQLRCDAARTGSRWGAAVADRGRGLVSGDVGALRSSANMLDRLGAPFEAARSRALIGEIGDRTAHRAVLVAALDAFQRLGARPWADRTAQMIGSTTSSRPAVVNALSQAELRVALLVGRGLTNREVADELFLSPRTVDSHLQRIYRKLGLRSRTELALAVKDHTQ